MSKKERTIVVGGLNVAMHRPHSPQRYVDLFKHAYGDRQIFMQGEIHGLMLGSLQGLDRAVENNEFNGEIYRFVKINADDPWFDLHTRRQATEDQVGQISIPENLLAHMQRIPFVFYPRQHELWFVARDRADSLSIPRTERFFQKLLEQAAQMHDYPEVAVTALPDQDALDEVLGVQGLHSVEVSFKRPNPDDGGDLEAMFEERLATMNVSRQTVVMTASRGQVLEPDEQFKAEAAVAARNGNVKSVGVGDGGIPIILTTAEKPRRVFMTVDEKIETVINVLRRARDH